MDSEHINTCSGTLLSGMVEEIVFGRNFCGKPLRSVQRESEDDRCGWTETFCPVHGQIEAVRERDAKNPAPKHREPFRYAENDLQVHEVLARCYDAGFFVTIRQDAPPATHRRMFKVILSSPETDGPNTFYGHGSFAEAICRAAVQAFQDRRIRKSLRESYPAYESQITGARSLYEGLEMTDEELAARYADYETMAEGPELACCLGGYADDAVCPDYSEPR